MMDDAEDANKKQKGVTVLAIMSSTPFRAGVEEYRKGVYPQFDEKPLTFFHEYGRLFAALVGPDFKIWDYRNRPTPQAIKLFKYSGIGMEGIDRETIAAIQSGQ